MKEYNLPCGCRLSMGRVDGRIVTDEQRCAKHHAEELERMAAVENPCERHQVDPEDLGLNEVRCKRCGQVVA